MFSLPALGFFEVKIEFKTEGFSCKNFVKLGILSKYSDISKIDSESPLTDLSTISETLPQAISAVNVDPQDVLKSFTALSVVDVTSLIVKFNTSCNFLYVGLKPPFLIVVFLSGVT